MGDHGGSWVAAREFDRLRREVLSEVRRTSRGNDVRQVAQQLDRGFAAAGIPQPSETVHTFAVGIASGRWPGLPLVGQLLHFAVRRRLPPGQRSEPRHLPGGRWVPVTVADTVMARAALSRSLRIQRWVTDHWAGSGPPPFTLVAVRLIPMAALDGGSEQVAALLGDSFAGTLPADLGPDLLTAIAAAEAVDERLMANARVGEVPDGYTLEVAVPDVAGERPRSAGQEVVT